MNLDPSPLTRWQVGNQAAKGRKSSKSGRNQALEVLDAMLGKDKNKKLLEVDLQKRFEEGPAAFMLEFIYPLLPKSARLEVVEGGLEFTWETLSNTPRTQGNSDSIIQLPDSES